VQQAEEHFFEQKFQMYREQIMGYVVSLLGVSPKVTINI
jgi:hypothetical protein